MPRKPKIHRLPSEQRRYIERLLREDRLTLDEMLAAIKAKFPGAEVPSRSSLGRYSQSVAEIAKRMRDIRAAGTAMVAELGEDPNDRAGQYLVETVTTLATHAAIQASDPGAEALSTKEVAELARATRAVQEARKMSLAERQQIAKEAREAQVREQRAKLDELGKSGAIDPAMLQMVIKAAYDL